MKLGRFFNLAAISMAAVLAAGCGSSLFAPRDRNPVVKDVLSRNSIFGENASVGVIGTDATRRLVIAVLKDDGTKICAEPSPDAANELRRKLVMALEAQVKEAGGGKISFDSDTLTKLNQLLQRSQGLQLFRDGNYFNCQDFANHAATPEQVNDRFEKLLKAASDLIALEIRSGMKQPEPPAPR